MEDKVYGEKYAKYYDLFNSQKDYSLESDFLDQVFKKYTKKKVTTILDLGCGTGVHDIKLAQGGYHVTGLDLSPEMIKLANSRKTGKNEFFIGDMSNFSMNNNFDACICMFSALGYLTKNRQIESFFSSIKKHLNKGGLIVIECWNGLGVLRNLPTSRVKEVTSGDTTIIRTSFPEMHYFNHICKVVFDVRIFNKGKLSDNYKEEHKVRFFFPKEIIKYAEDAGFEILEICEPFKIGTKIDENSWNMALIARLKNKKT